MPVWLFIDPDGDAIELGRTHPETSDEAPCVTIHVASNAAEASLWFDELHAGRCPHVSYEGAQPVPTPSRIGREGH
jgi:hypothetical protein